MPETFLIAGGMNPEHAFYSRGVVVFAVLAIAIWMGLAILRRRFSLPVLVIFWVAFIFVAGLVEMHWMQADSEAASKAFQEQLEHDRQQNANESTPQQMDRN